MAGVNKFILEYRDTFRDLQIDFDNHKPPEKTMRRFICLLKNIDDVRATGMIDYPLEEIVGIVFLAVLGNATSWQEIALFGKVSAENGSGNSYHLRKASLLTTRSEGSLV